MTTLIVSLIILFSHPNSVRQDDELRRKNFNIKDKVAIEGFDPVSYFNGKPQEGKSDLYFSHHGVTYLFASASNLNKFKMAPEKYEPAYGGWCAYAMGDTGEKVKIDPETFTILEGRLYLFYNFWGNNTLKDWKEDERKLKEAADRNWSKLLR